MPRVELIADRPEFAWMLDMVATVVGNEKATYVSVPITTGPRLVEWFRSLRSRGEPLPDPRRPEGSHERVKNVIEPNLRAASEFVASIRRRIEGPIIDPSSLKNVPGWRQEDYISLWESVIQRFAKQIVLADGWNYSFGCAHEFLFATGLGLPTFNANLTPIDRATGLRLLSAATWELSECGADVSFLISLLSGAGEPVDLSTRMRTQSSGVAIAVNRERPVFKDAILDWLADRGNVAQFVSFDPNGTQRFCRIKELPPNHVFACQKNALEALFDASGEGQVNVRTFRPESPAGNPFRTRLKTIDSAMAEIQQLNLQGYYCICNELVNESDGGVSGVAHGNWLEFGPDIFPRDIETKEVAAMPRTLGLRVLERIYGHRPSIDYPWDQRVEFTVTTRRRGHRNERTLIWEVTSATAIDSAPQITWPNPLSRMVGDKAFGLTVADALGFLVPFTTVLPRRIAPWTFGRLTGSQEHWVRTCPREPIEGYFKTERDWSDPFKLMTAEDESADQIPSLLAQDAVRAQYSGNVLTQSNGLPLIEGVSGTGEDFMMGRKPPETIPQPVIGRVRHVHERLQKELGGTSFEWADDGEKTWLLQLHVRTSASNDGVFFDGFASSFRTFVVTDGLSALRKLVKEIQGTDEGVLVVGKVGITSHLGGILRDARIPSRLANP